MTTLTLQALGSADTLGARLAQLDPRTQREVVERAVEWGVRDAADEWARTNGFGRGFGALGQEALTSAISVAVERALTPLMPTLGARLMEVAEPAARKAAEVVGPVVEQKLRDYGPKLALITGLAAAILSIIGMVVVGGYVVRKVG